MPRLVLSVFVVVATLIATASTAQAKINPTISARSCLLRAIDRGDSPAPCFSAEGWAKGRAFLNEARQRGWQLKSGDESGCCTLPVHWAEVELWHNGTRVGQRYLILKRSARGMSIVDIQTRHPDPRRR